MQPLGPALIVLVTLIAFGARPHPGLAGTGLAVSFAVGGFALGGLGAMFTRYGSSEMATTVHVTFVAVLFVSSAALVWLQPQGTSVFGLFVAVVLLARRLPSRVAISLAALALVVLIVTTVAAPGTQRSVASALLTAIAIVGFCGITFLVRRLRETNEQAERLVIEMARTRSAEARAAALGERQRLAREMHDVLAHSLSGLILHLEGARLLAVEDPTDPRLLESIERAHHLGKTGLEEARRAIGMLRDDDLPGPDRLASLTAQFERDRGVPCRLTVSGDAQELGSQARLAVYRVAQEALTNIAKHADPERVEVCLAYEPRETRLAIEDFATDATNRPPPAESGYGLTGMRERAELLGGQLTAAPTGSGFRVELRVPT